MIGHCAGHQGQSEQGQKLHQSHHADKKGALFNALGSTGNVIDLPAERHRLNHHGQGRSEARDPEMSEIAVSEYTVGTGVWADL